MIDKPRKFYETLGTGQPVYAPFSGTVKDIHASCRDEIERWRNLAIHAWCHMGMDATCSDYDCEECQTIKKAWESK